MNFFTKKKKELVQVHMNRTPGVYSRWLEIGNEIPADIVEKCRDSQTGALYIFETVAHGEPQKYVCKNKDAWIAVTTKIDECVRDLGEEFLTSIPEKDRLPLVRTRFRVRLRGRRSTSARYPDSRPHSLP